MTVTTHKRIEGEVCLILIVRQINCPTMKADKKRKKLKRTARIICRDQNEYWTTQAQFWQWVRELKVIKSGDNPLTGKFAQPHEESMIVIANTVLNAAHRNHLNEAIQARKYMKPRKN